MSYNFDEVWNTCLLFNIEQKPEEYKPFLDFLFDNSKKKYALEIGSNYGGTACGLCHIFENVITLDIKHHENFDKLKQLFPHYQYIIGDSRSNDILELFKRMNIKFDFIFIDGDHSYEGVKNDYEKYKNLLASDGYIGFHDIIESSENKNNNIFVHQLWNELKETYPDNHSFFCNSDTHSYKKDNLFHQIMSSRSYENWGGIGLIKNSPVYIFCHNYLINNWESVVSRQFKKLVDSHLYFRSDYIFFGVCSPSDDDYDRFLTLIKSWDVLNKIKIERYLINNYEFPTLIHLQNYCKNNTIGTVLYYHTKGVSKNPNDECIKSWAVCLEYFNIENWKLNLKNLQSEHFDISGALYTTFYTLIDDDNSLITQYKNYYSGNFWWATSDHICNLPNLIEVVNDENNRKKWDYRVLAEMWIGSGQFFRWSNLYNGISGDYFKHIWNPLEYEFKKS